MHLPLHLAPGLDILGPDRLFEEERIIGRERIAELDCLSRLEDAGMSVEGNLVVGAHGLAQRRKYSALVRTTSPQRWAWMSMRYGLSLKAVNPHPVVEPIEFVARAGGSGAV